MGASFHRARLVSQALLDEGIFSPEDFELEKAKLVCLHDQHLSSLSVALEPSSLTPIRCPRQSPAAVSSKPAEASTRSDAAHHTSHHTLGQHVNRCTHAHTGTHSFGSATDRDGKARHSGNDHEALQPHARGREGDKGEQMTRARPGGAGERENGDASLLESTIDSFHQASRTLSANFSAAAGWMQGSGASHLVGAERGASEGGADEDDGHGSGMQEGGGDGGNEHVLGGAEPVALDVLEREFELTYIHSFIHSFIHTYIHSFIHSSIHLYIHTGRP